MFRNRVSNSTFLRNRWICCSFVQKYWRLICQRYSNR